jgi:hypothetical protein
MAANRRYQQEGCWAFGVVTGLFVILLSWTGAWSQGQDLQAGHTPPRRAEKWLSVTVQQEQLSVDARGADMAELLAQIGQQASIRMLVPPSARRQISAQLAGLELDEGLRRLFRLASLSYAILYVRGPGGTVRITEVRVFGEKPGGAASLAQDPPSAGDRQEDAAASATNDQWPGHYIHRVIPDSSG